MSLASWSFSIANLPHSALVAKRWIFQSGLFFVQTVTQCPWTEDSKPSFSRCHCHDRGRPPRTHSPCTGTRTEDFGNEASRLLPQRRSTRPCELQYRHLPTSPSIQP